MIEIAGQSVSGQMGFSQQLVANPTAMAILETMRKSRIPYRFSSEAELNFRLEMGANIISAAHALNRSGASFATFYNSRCNEAFWDLTPDGGFRLKTGAEPSSALLDIFQNGSLYAFECATGMVIVLYKAVLDSIGVPSFNQNFSDLYLWDWEFDWDLGLEWTKPQDYFPGDVRYFKNPDVNPLHIEWQGENVIDMGNGLYFGHGIGVVSAEGIIAALNRRRRPGAERSAFLMEDAARPSFSHLLKLAGRQLVRNERIGEGIRDRYVTVTFGNSTHVF